MYREHIAGQNHDIKQVINPLKLWNSSNIWERT